MLQKAKRNNIPEDITNEKKIAKEMLKEMGILIKVLLLNTNINVDQYYFTYIDGIW